MRKIKLCVKHNCNKNYDDKWKRYICTQCRHDINSNYYQTNKDKIKKRIHHYQIDNRETIKIRKKKYYRKNKSCISKKCKIYYLNNAHKKSSMARHYYRFHKQLVLKQKQDYNKYKRKIDPTFRLRRDISTMVTRCLSNNNGSKNSVSLLKYLTYSIQELRDHLEKRFEPWMNWNNYGVYRIKSWNDNDSNTWRWNIDHIIPQSRLPYSSMGDDNFKKCWALSNLRPYSAKQNVIDNNKRILDVK